MAAYYRSTLAEFIAKDPNAISGQLNDKYAHDGFKQQYLSQVRAWAELVPLLQAEVRNLLEQEPSAAQWAILLEFPLYRLQRRIDVVILASSVIVIEAKVGEDRFLSGDERQVEEYCLGAC